MSLSNATVWEVRPTVGLDTNGGGFVAGASGTDYSQQNAAQYSASDLTVDAVNDQLVTSVSHTFVSADVGNLMNISAGSGFTTGYYQITGISGGGALLDRSPAATSTSGGTYAVGGALATVNANLVADYTAENTVYIKATGTLTLTSQIGPLNNTLFFIGYTSIRGDNGQATITTATNSTALFNVATNPGKFWSWANFILSNTAGTPAAAVINSNGGNTVSLAFFNILCEGCTTLQDLGGNGVQPLVLDSVEVKNTTGTAGVMFPYTANFTVIAIACYFHDNAGHGFQAQSQNGQYFFERCVSAFNTGNGWSLGGSGGGPNNLTMMNCAAVGNADGIHFGDTGALVSVNCVIELNSGFGINATSTPLYQDVRNPAFFNNTSGNFTGINAPSQSVALTGDPFISSSGGNFNLNSTAGEGLACQGAGFPSTIPG